MFTKISLQDHGFANPHPSYERSEKGLQTMYVYMIRKAGKTTLAIFANICDVQLSSKTTKVIF